MEIDSFSKSRKELNMNDNNHEVNLVKLRSTSDEMQLSMIKQILDDNDIPYIIKDHGAGGYMRIISGSSLYGTDVMVEEIDFQKANSLLESISIE